MTEHEYLLVVGKERVDAAREMLNRAMFAEDAEGEGFQCDVHIALRRLDKLAKKLHDAVQALPDEEKTDVTCIDRHNYSAIFTLCVDILLDNGGVNRAEPFDSAKKIFLLPAHPAAGFAHMEAAARELAHNMEDFSQFATGEDTVAEAIAKRDPHLQQLHGILNAWFEQGMPTA